MRVSRPFVFVLFFFPSVPPLFSDFLRESAPTATWLAGGLEPRGSINSGLELSAALTGKPFPSYDSGQAPGEGIPVPAFRSRLSPHLYPAFRGFSATARDRD